VARGVEPWDGVHNPTALGNLRRAQVGDHCVIYHSGKDRAAVGLATVSRTAYPDPKLDNPKLIVIDVTAGPRLARPVGLDELKRDTRFEGNPLVRQPRLSVVPLTVAQYDAILELAAD
jgi:predicted RNA-binding protein with PUA-like domain